MKHTLCTIAHAQYSIGHLVVVVTGRCFFGAQVDMGAHRPWCPTGYELFATECSKGVFDTTNRLLCHCGIFITEV